MIDNEGEKIVPIDPKYVHLAKLMSKIQEGEHAIADLEEEREAKDEDSHERIDAEIGYIRKVNGML